MGNKVRRYDDKDWPMQWTCFEPDKTMETVENDWEAGYFSYRLYFKKTSGEKESKMNWED